MTRTLRIGTRGSPLALVQARWTVARLAEHGAPSELVIIRTEGDDRPADTAWGEGAFVARIAAALLDGSVDVAVHSAKDVPTEDDPRLVVAAYPPREDPRDALVGRERGTTLARLPLGARVGTDSPRRTAFLLAARPDLRLHPLHGNVDTRLAKLDAGDSDALVLAVAGLTRLGRADRIDEVLAPDLDAPAPGQGSLAIQVRADDAEAREAVGRLDDPATRAAVEAERGLLAATGGGCRSPIGALARVEGDEIVIVAGAERETRRRAPGEPGTDRVGWVHARGPVEDRLAVARRAAARIVRLRHRPRVVVTRPAAQASELVDRLEALELEPILVPAIEIRPTAPGGELDAAVAALPAGAWIALTSANAADAVLAAVARLGIDPSRHRWAAVGGATAARLEQAGIAVAFRPATPTGAALATELPVEGRDAVLLPRADLADLATPARLDERGARVIEAVAYETIEGPGSSRPLLAAALDDGPIDAVVLTSGSTVRGLLALAPDAAARDRLRGSLAVAIGAPTAAVARSCGFRDVVEAEGRRAVDLADLVHRRLARPAAAAPEPVPTGDPR